MTISGRALGASSLRPQQRPAAVSLSTPLAAAMAARNLYYGWVIAGATFLVMLATAGAMGAPGVILRPLEEEFGWSTEQISVALAVRLALYGLIAPFAAAFINRFGVRPVVVSAVAMIVAGIVASMAMTEVWELVALWGVIVGIGTGMVALVLGATIATRWFVHRRGLVVGLLTASNATGQLVFLPLVAKLTEAYGWRSALAFVVAMLIAAGSVALLILRDRPADVGLAPFGERAIQPAPKQDLGLGAMMASPLRALYEARFSRTFWVLFATFFVCGLSTNGLIQTHWVSLCGDYGIAPVAAAGALAVIGAFDFVGTILSGWLSDRYDNRMLLMWYFGLRGLSLLYLPYSHFDFATLSVFAVFYGLDWLATVPPMMRQITERFGKTDAPVVFGWIFAGHQMGAGSIAFLAGALRTDLGSYLLPFLLSGTLCLAAALLVLRIGTGRLAAAAAD